MNLYRWEKGILRNREGKLWKDEIIQIEMKNYEKSK